MSVKKYGQVQNIPIDKIDVSPFQVRMEYGDITELAANIKKIGLLSPILVRPIAERYEIVHGHRRFMAHNYMNKKYIPGVVKELTDKLALIIHGSENIQRQEFSPIETARYYDRCRKFFSVKEIAKELKKSESHIRYHLYLIDLPEDIQTKIHKGEISYSKARQLAKLTMGTTMTPIVGNKGLKMGSLPTYRTIQYYPQIRKLARDESLRDAQSIAKAAELIREGIKVEEAIREAKKDYATRRSIERWKSRTTPNTLIGKLIDVTERDKKISDRYSQIIHEIQLEKTLLCPKCGESITYPTQKIDELINLTHMEILDAQHLTKELTLLLKELR